MLEFLVGCGGGDEEAFLVTCGKAADYAGSCDCGVADGNDVLEFGFEDTVRLSVLRPLVVIFARRREVSRYAHL